MLRVAFAVALVLTGITARAQEGRDYLCTIERIANAEGVDDKSLEMRRKNFVGQQFSVSRRTGIMSGALKNSYFTLPEVIDIGSSGNSFKAVTTMRREQGMGPGSNVHVLVVREYESSPKKTFVYLDNDELYFGKCIHF
ncbi:MAG TPA: hypothetical protein VM512_09370 [Burkholderiaceae bacterium]|jgi:hypothetical protein|nr:hypothetical protein [Burkholderiaceae bacterium]